MITISLHDNNRLIRKTIVRMFPSSFAATLTVGVALMVDTLLAGALLGQQAIAAVAIGTPAIGIFQALTQTVVSGAAVKMTISAGRSDTQKMNRACALGISATALLGLVFIAVCLLLADRLAMAFGGAGNPAVAAQAALYLRAGSVCILMGSLNTFWGKILTLFGYQKDVLRAALIAMTGNPEFRGGVLLCLLFIPLCLVTRLLVQVFETTGKTAMGLLYSIVPDSVIYPLLLAALLPVLGYDGIWLAYSANVLPFGLVLYLVRSVKAGTLRMNWERLLCLEELAADFVAHTLQEGKQDAERVIMDIKLFSDEDRLRVVIRNEAAAYNPLDFSLDDTTFAKVGVKLAQKVARRIEYSYVYKLNIVTIDVDK